MLSFKVHRTCELSKVMLLASCMQEPHREFLRDEPGVSVTIITVTINFGIVG